MASSDVAVISIPNHKRSAVCCAAMYQGITQLGDKAVLITEDQYKGPTFAAAVFYGYTPKLRAVMADYKAIGKPAVYIDLGYWEREGLQGHHKIVINARHPTEYFQRVKHKLDRLRKVKVSIQKWRQGEHILLAGMGQKAAEVEGYQVEVFERMAIAELRRYTDRPIIYRPKPSWLQAQPLPDTRFSNKEQHLNSVLLRAHAVVTHHSNVAVEGIIAGVPAFCWGGVARCMSSQDLSKIDDPYRPEDREQWAADIAYCQWSIDEMSRGLPWKHLKDEGFIP